MQKKSKGKIIGGCVALILLCSMCSSIIDDDDTTSATDTDTVASITVSSETNSMEEAETDSDLETDTSAEISSNTDESDNKTVTVSEKETETDSETNTKDTESDIVSDTDSEVNEEFYLDLTQNLYSEIDTTGLELFVGELQSINNCGDGVVVVKAKITSSWNNEMTIRQNYHNIEDLIINHGFEQCSEIQYWAVADMTSGDESKVISFTVNNDTIKGVYNQNIVAIELGDYVDDLWIHPSLQ